MSRRLRIGFAAAVCCLVLTLSAQAAHSACTIAYLSRLQAVSSDLKAASPDIAAELNQLQQISDSQHAAAALAPVIADLRAGNTTAARQRLDVIVAALQVPANTVCNVDTGGAREALHKVYQSPVFADLDKPVDQSPSLVERILDVLSRLVGGVTGALGTAGTIVLAAAILLLLLGFVAWRLRQAGGAAAGPRHAESGGGSADPDIEWRLGVEAAERGEHREAIRRVFRSALLSVAIGGRLPVNAAWTTRELLAQAARDPDLAEPLAAAAAGFDHAWYSGDDVDAADWEQARMRCRAIRDLADRHRPVAA